MKIGTIHGTVKATEHKGDATKLFLAARSTKALDKLREIAPTITPNEEKPGRAYPYFATVTKEDAKAFLGGLAATIGYTSYSKAKHAQFVADHPELANPTGGEGDLETDPEVEGGEAEGGLEKDTDEAVASAGAATEKPYQPGDERTPEPETPAPTEPTSAE